MTRPQSRLDLFIDRMVSQRASLDHAAAAIADVPGPVFELGLGNGRTYHHMCAILPDRDIYVFERAIASHPDRTPPEDRVLLGDVFETLPQTLDRFGPTAALIHADLGGHNAAKNDAFARRISPVIGASLSTASSARAGFSAEKPCPPNRPSTSLTLSSDSAA